MTKLSLHDLNSLKLDATKEAVDSLKIDAATINDGLTVKTSVPENAKFTDTIYTHPSTHPVNMITGLHNVATSGSYNDLINKPTTMLANGGNADTVDSCHVNDSTTSLSNLWTSKKIQDKLNEKANSSHNHQQQNVLEIGQYIDFHVLNSQADYDGRLSVQNGTLVFNSPSISSIDIIGEIDSLKLSVGNGKNSIASAITNKGVSASGSDNFDVLATKIEQIQGIKTYGQKIYNLLNNKNFSIKVQDYIEELLQTGYIVIFEYYVRLNSVTYAGSESYVNITSREKLKTTTGSYEFVAGSQSQKYYLTFANKPWHSGNAEDVTITCNYSLDYINLDYIINKAWCIKM